MSIIKVQNAPLTEEEQPHGHLPNYSNLCRIKNSFQLPSEMPYENTIKLKQHHVSRNPLSNIQHQEGKEHLNATITQDIHISL